MIEARIGEPLCTWMLDQRYGPRGAPGIGKTAKTFVTCDSRVVPHRSTEQAQGCLTSEFGWDPVFSPWYERMMRLDRAAATRASAAPAIT